MLPSNGIFQRRDVLLSADTTTLAPAANPPKVRLLKAPFTPADDLVWADLTECDFDGYAAIACAVGAQAQSIDPLTGASLVTMLAPVGGWRWETTGLTNLPQTVYGWTLVPNDLSSVYGSELFDTPIVLQGVNEQVLIPTVQFATLPGTME